MLRVVVGLTVVLSSASALADEAAARQKYDAAERAYNLGEFEKAVQLFKEAYNEHGDPAFLFNVAQTYRQAGDCRQALFFYKRYLALKQNDTKKPLSPARQAEVEQRISELEVCVKDAIASKPPTATQPPGSGGSGTTTRPDTAEPTTTATTSTAQAPEQVDDGEEEEEPTSPTPGLAPTTISARLDGGAAIFTAGDLDRTTLFAAALIAGYPLSINDKLRIELGAAFSFAPVPYTITPTNEKSSGSMIGLMGNVAPSYMLIPKLAARLDVGIGALVFSGLEKEGNPFTMGGTAATGPLSTFHARVAASIDYAVTPNLVLTATPIAFGYSPAPSGFESSISSLTTLSFLAGIGYQR